MATLEERLTVIEHEYAHLKHDNEELKHGNEELKQKIELHTIAIGALVNKASLESLNEKYDKIFQALIAHDEFTNRQLSELRERVEVQVEGKIVGLQTEMRQRFEEVNSRFESQGKQLESHGKQLEFQGKQLESHGKQLEQILLLLTNKSE